MKPLIKLIINSLAVLVTAYLLKSGVIVDGIFTAIVVSLVLAIINTFIRPIVMLLALPINFISLGLFTFIINGLLVLLVQVVVPGFQVQGLLWAILFSVVMSIISWFLNLFVK